MPIYTLQNMSEQKGVFKSYQVRGSDIKAKRGKGWKLKQGKGQN